jgi:hypothetical protein
MHAEPRGSPSSRDESVTNDEVVRSPNHYPRHPRLRRRQPVYRCLLLVSQGSMGTVINDPYTGAKTTRIT